MFSRVSCISYNAEEVTIYATTTIYCCVGSNTHANAVFPSINDTWFNLLFTNNNDIGNDGSDNGDRNEANHYQKLHRLKYTTFSNGWFGPGVLDLFMFIIF